MNILGICDNHDSGAVLIKDRAIAAAVSEERLNREKGTRAFPYRSVDYVLRSGGLTIDDIDTVALASSMTPLSVFRLLNRQYSRMLSEKNHPSSFSYLLNLLILYETLARKCILPIKAEAFLSGEITRRRLGFRGKIRVIDHHAAHAASAYYASGFTDALVITIDYIGDGLSLTVSLGKGRELTRLFSQSGFSAVGSYYARITDSLGFISNRHEGKITGLAAYGDSSKARPLMRELLRCRDGGFNNLNYLLPTLKDSGTFARLAKFSREDIAAGAQENLEEQVCRFISYWAHRTRARRVALAGGLFANVKLNQRIHEDLGLEICVFPHMGDGGLSLGAALQAERPHPSELSTAYLGPEFTDGEIEEALARSGLRYERCKDIEQRVGKLLSEGRIIGRFSGRMEWGPRALGNRSILCEAKDPMIVKVLNKKLKRTDFMPFAPATLAEKSGQMYMRLKGAESCSRYMTITFACTGRMKRLSPAVVHVDGTARPQLVSSADNPSFYRILKGYEALTGIPTVLNTSFNIHEEPIVCTPGDAIATFKSCRLDCLAIGNYLAESRRTPRS